MKIRNGFVSNSSSSSFVIRTDGDFKTVYDVAKRMMSEMQSDPDLGMNFQEELMTLENMKDKDTPVYFDSYDGGYIRKFKDYIIVSTTMHYTPMALINNNIISVNEIGADYFKELNWCDEEYNENHEVTTEEDFDYYWKQFNDFLMLKSGFRGVWDYDFDNPCPDCGRNPMGRALSLQDGGKLCSCKATKKYARKLKLEEIKDNE